MKSRYGAVIVLGFFIVGCSSSSSPGRSTAGAGCSGTCDGATGTSACPSSPPNDGEKCSFDESITCEYGDDPRLDCRTQAACQGGAWQVKSASCSPMAQAGENGCPISPPTSGSACPKDGLVCQMLGGDLCACATCLGGPCLKEPQWACAPPPSTEGCPEEAPLLGTQCSSEGLLCSYGVRCVTSIGTNRVCQGGIWVKVLMGCQI